VTSEALTRLNSVSGWSDNLDDGLAKMTGKIMKVPWKAVTKMVEANEHNKYITVYYLLKRKHDRGELDLTEFNDHDIAKVIPKQKGRVSSNKEKYGSTKIASRITKPLGLYMPSKTPSARHTFLRPSFTTTPHPHVGPSTSHSHSNSTSQPPIQVQCVQVPYTSSTVGYPVCASSSYTRSSKLRPSSTLYMTAQYKGKKSTSKKKSKKRAQSKGSEGLEKVIKRILGGSRAGHSAISDDCSQEADLHRESPAPQRNPPTRPVRKCVSVGLDKEETAKTGKAVREAKAAREGYSVDYGKKGEMSVFRQLKEKISKLKAQKEQVGANLRLRRQLEKISKAK